LPAASDTPRFTVLPLRKKPVMRSLPSASCR